MLKNWIFLVAVALLLAPDCSGAGTEGASGGQFLRIGVGAKSSALGEAAAAGAGVQSLFCNPSGLSGVNNAEAAFSQVQWVGDINYSNLAVAKKAGAGVYGLAVSYLSMASIPRYNNLGVRLSDNYSAMDTAATLGYGRALTPRTSLGMGIKYISSKLESETAAAAAADAGIKYDVIPEALSAGLAVQNLGTPLKYINKSDPLPLNVKLGAQYIFKIENDIGAKNNIVVLSDINHMKDSGFYANLGIDIIVNYSADASFSVRGGYKTNAGEKDAGLSLGFGINMGKYAVDYAYSPMGDLGKAHRITLTLRFDGEKRK